MAWSESKYRSKPTYRKQKNGISKPRILAMVVSLVIITSVGILVFEWLWGSFLNSPLFTLKGVSVQGNYRISSADILDASQLSVGDDSIYSFMSHTTEKRIRALSRYLEHVQVERKFAIRRSEGMYGWVTITIKEREPVALVGIERDADYFIVVDAHGFALEKVRTDPYTGPKSSYGDDLPVIAGVDIGELKLGVQNKLPVLSLALDVLEDARSVIPELLDEISCVDARDRDNIVLCLRTHNVSLVATGNRSMSEMDIRIASDRVRDGLRNALPVITRRIEEAKETEYIDARFPGAIYCGEKIEKLEDIL